MELEMKETEREEIYSEVGIVFDGVLHFGSIDCLSYEGIPRGYLLKLNCNKSKFDKGYHIIKDMKKITYAYRKCPHCFAKMEERSK